MALAAGTRLGPYEIGSLIGAGGMGEVYKARDTRLDRTVAIKVLPPHFASDAELRQRFEREARAIAGLNHPHICVLHDVGQDNGTDFLVMEHLQGETLVSRLDKGPLPIDVVLRTGIEIADALDKAHRQGVVHRDLKPANVMMTRSGAKLLDFGIAKRRAEPVMSDGVSRAITDSVPLTGKGTLLGTLQYMSPEQLEGKEADARSDIFALGAMLYEMVTGTRAFDGSSQVSLMAAILEHEPRPLSQLQPRTPPALEHVIQGCLAKSPDDRWQTAHDVMKQLKWIEASGLQVAGAGAAAPARKQRGLLWIGAAGVAVALVAAAIGIAWYRRAPEPTEQTRFTIDTPDMPGPTQLSISPNGREVAFVARASPTSAPSLFVRSLDSVEARQLPGTDNASFPFWSPDSRHIGFSAQGKLKRIELAGGPPQNLCDCGQGFLGGTWNADGVIVFGATGGPLMRVAASGGDPKAVVIFDEKQDIGHGFPVFLPDGRHFLFVARAAPSAVERQGIFVGSLDSMDAVQILRADSTPLYAPPGYLLFRRDRTLMAQAFDADRLSLSGEPIPIADGLALSNQNFRPAAGVSNTGTLVYRTSTAGVQTQLVWYDRTGKPLGTVGSPGQYRGIALSPDDRRIAAHIHQEPSGGDIWILDADRGTSTRFTFHPSHNLVPTWSRDGNVLTFASDRDGGISAVYQKSSSGAGDDEVFFKDTLISFPEDWTPDQRTLSVGHQTPGRQMGVWVVPAAGERKITPLVDTEFAEILSKFSPDGRWVAYASNESGRNEIFVRPYPQGAGKWQISTLGGSFVRWARSGKELFYLTEDGSVMAVQIQSKGDVLSAGIPRVLFRSRAMFGDHLGNVYPYDVSSDAQRFLINERLTDANQNVPITVVMNWTAALTR